MIKWFKRFIIGILVLVGFGVISFHQPFLNQHVLKPLWIPMIPYVQSAIIRFYIEPFNDGASVDADHVISTMDNGMPIVVNKHDRCVCWSIRFRGLWDSSEMAVIKNLIKPGFKIIEAGANFGVHTLSMAKIVGENGHVYAFEANPHVSKYLKQSIFDLNHLTNVTLYEKGLGDQAKSLFLNFGLANIGGGTLANEDSGTSVKTEIVRLDDALKDIKVDMLKMDTEGYEGKILEGAQDILKNNPDMIIMMEWSQDALRAQGSDPKSILENLASHGFDKIWKIGERRSKEEGTLFPLTMEEVLNIPYCDLVLSRRDLNVQ